MESQQIRLTDIINLLPEDSCLPELLEEEVITSERLVLSRKVALKLQREWVERLESTPIMPADLRANVIHYIDHHGKVAEEIEHVMDTFGIEYREDDEEQDDPLPPSDILNITKHPRYRDFGEDE